MNIGLIGVGRHGMRYAEHLFDSKSPGQLVAICRRNTEQGSAFAQKHNVRFHQHYQSLIHDPDVEAIVIVTPPKLNLPIAIEAIQTRKPLLIEKPLAVSTTEARQIVEHASQAYVPLMVAHTLRYDITIEKLKEFASDIGAWRYLALTARFQERPLTSKDISMWNGRGAVLEFGVHLFDLARSLTEEEVRNVSCEVNHQKTDEPEDQAWGRLITQSGMPCLFDISRVSDSRMTRIELIGQTGQVSVNWTTATVSLQRQRNPPETHQLTPTPTIDRVMKDFIHALQTKTPMPITGADGLRAVEIAEACYDSAAIRSAINIDRSL